MTTDTAQQEQFQRLIDQHRGIVFKVTNTYSFHPEDRVDLAQEIIAQLWRSFPRYDAQRPFPTWAYRVALNVAISHVRSNSRRQRLTVPLNDELHDIADEGPDVSGTEQRIRALHRFIARQDKLDRALLLLYLEDHSYQGIADILGITVTNVGTKISRLKQRIRVERWTDDPPTDTPSTWNSTN